MTKELFIENHYMSEHQAKVEKIDGKRVLLNETIFFPATSTEPGDIGKINGIKLAGLKREGGDIWHILIKDPNFNEGDTVRLEINWNKRYNMMKLHSALHHWASILDTNFNERAVAGVVKSKEAYLVFKHRLSQEIIDKSLKLAADDIQSGIEIKTRPDETRHGFRWCQVGDYNPIPCGGLHVKNTNEIGKISIVKEEADGNKHKISIKRDSFINK